VAARSELYAGRKVVVTPLPENRPEAIARVREAWAACGAVLHEMSPQEHDRVFAAVSHLPHLLAFGLVHEIQARGNAEQLFSFAASGFRDFTRIAASHPEMWRDICLANRVALLGELESYRAQLDELHVALSQNDGGRLEEIFGIARQARRSWAGEG
jgi:prephenate dehydrogenase